MTSTYDFTSSRKSAGNRFDYYVGIVLFQIIKMFPKMKVDERNAALKVMLVRSLSHPFLTELKLEICYLDFRYSYTLALLY